MKHVCDNCGKKWDLRDVVYAPDLSQRVDPGGVMPTGECRDCGALCYPEYTLTWVKTSTKKRRKKS